MMQLREKRKEKTAGVGDSLFLYKKHNNWQQNGEEKKSSTFTDLVSQYTKYLIIE